MDVEAKHLFELIDDAYNEPILNQPSKAYKAGLLKMANELVAGTDLSVVWIKLIQVYRTNYMVPMTLPRRNRTLYQYLVDHLKTVPQSALRASNAGYGAAATHIIFGPF